MKLMSGRAKIRMRQELLSGFFRIIFVLLILLVPSITAQTVDEAVQDYPRPEARITEETDFSYYYLFNYVFPDTKSTDPRDYFNRKENAATRSIPLRNLFGKGFSKLNERRRVAIKQTRWLRTKNNRKFFVVLFEATAPENQNSDKKNFFALAVFSYYRMKVPEMSVFSAYKWKWSYVFELVDAASPGTDSVVELAKNLPVFKNRRGEDSFWLLSSRTAGDESFKNYAAIELYGGRLRVFSKDFPLIYNNSGCAHRFEQNLEVIQQKVSDKAVLPFEIRIVSQIWMNDACRALDTIGDLREIETYQPRWQIRSRRLQLVRFQLMEKKVGKTTVAGANSRGATGIPDCDDYLEKYEICLRKTLYRGTSNRAEAEKYLNMIRDSWLKGFSMVTDRAAATTACQQAKQAAQQNLTAFGCEW